MSTSNAHNSKVSSSVGSLRRHVKTSLVFVMSICFAVASYGDTYVPTLAKISPTGGSLAAYVNQSLTFKVESSDSGGNLSKVELWVDSALTSTQSFSGTVYYGQASFTRAFPTSGAHNVSIVARDTSGHASTWVGWAITVTNRTPTAATVSPTTASVSVVKGSSVSFSVSGSDPDGNLRGVEWYLNGAYLGLTSLSGSTGTASHTEYFGVPGTYTVGALVHDTEFKYASAVSWTVNVTGSTLTGTVRDSSTSGVVPNATVTFNGVSTTTNTSGVYTLTNVACVSSTLTVSKIGYQTSSIGYSLAACGGTSTKDVTLTPSSSTLTGTVRDSSTNAVIPNATVTFNGVNSTTNTSGVYTLTNVACVSSTLTVSKTGYQTSSIGYSLTACGGTSTKDVTLTPSGSTLTGTVRDSSTNAVTRAPRSLSTDRASRPPPPASTRSRTCRVSPRR